MLQTVADLKRMSIGALDGEIGHVKDAYFDDCEWTLRYLVVNPGTWLNRRWVLITPWSIRAVDWDAQQVHIPLTREQVRGSPDIDTDKPVARQHEVAYFDYYGYPHYWTGPFSWGPVPFPTDTVDPASDAGSAVGRAQRSRERGDPHLRSANEVSGYQVEAADGSIGHVDDFLFDDRSWSLRYFVVDTRNWLPGHHVLISTDWVERVSWEGRKVHVSLTREEVRSSPEYDRESFTETAEYALYRHYGRPLERPTVRAQIR